MPQNSFTAFPASRWLHGESDQAMTDVLALCDLARSITDARAVSLTLAEAHLAALLPSLQVAGLSAKVAADLGFPPPEGNSIPGPYRVRGTNDWASDEISVAVPALAADNTALAQIELENARADTLSATRTGQLHCIGRLLARRLEALTGAQTDLSGRMLGLIDAVHDHDEHAASRVLTGLLRIAGGKAASLVETTALRISGLAEVVGGKVALTVDGQNTLRTGGMVPVARAVAIRPMPGMDGVRMMPPQERPAPQFLPIARLDIGGTIHEIGESSDETSLGFRVAGAGAQWKALNATRADGWASIAVEVLSQTHDILLDYVRMHMIRRRDIDLPELAEVYDLHGLEWWVRPGDACFETRRGGGADWAPISVTSANQTVPSSAFELAEERNRAVNALLQLWPDLGERIGDDVRSWSRRMALGAVVTPIMDPVAA